MPEEFYEESSKLTIPNNMGYLSIILDYVRGVADRFKFSRIDQRKIELAVEEAVANVINHAFEEGEQATFDIMCKKLPQGLQIVIHDNGLPFDPNATPEYSPDSDIDSLSAKGLGNHLIREIMDEFEFVNMGMKGKETRFLKYFDSQGIFEGIENQQPEEPEPPKKSTEKINFTIRLIKPEEAVEVSRCVYDSYGYSYANEHIYFPERVAAMNADGKLKSAVAVTDSGEVGGHFALIFYKWLPAEIGIAVTKKKFRGQSVAADLGRFLDQEAIKMGLKGLQVREVTVHPYTQKFCQKLGYADCGYLLAHSPTTMSFKGIADELAHRNTDIVGFKYFNEPENRTIYAPENHKGIIKKLYQNLNVPVTFADPESNEFTEELTTTDISASSIRSVCEIHIPQYGKDIQKALKQELSTMRKNEIKVAEMYLNLMNPLTPKVVSEAEKLGFFFTGILPETNGYDSIILQYFNGIEMNYDAPIIVSDTAKELLEYIKAHDPHNK